MPPKRKLSAASSGTRDDSATSEDEVPTAKKIPLAISCSHGRVGAAYFHSLKSTLYLLEDTQESHHFDLTIMLLEQASPDIVLTSSKSDDDFIDTLRDHSDITNVTFQIRPHKEFNTTKGNDRLLYLNRLANLPVDDHASSSGSFSTGVGVAHNAYDFMRKRHDETGDPTMKRWNASIRLSNFSCTENSPLCVSSAGALIDYLAREQAMSDLDDEGIQGLAIREIEIFTLNEVMHINADALLSLQVFENESHASVHSDKFKEGLSLYGTLNYTKTALGRSLLHSWLLRPSLSLTVIKSRHEAVACFSRSENLIPANTMHNHLKGIKNLPRILTAMKAGKTKLSDWQALAKFSFHIVMLCDTITELHGGNDIDVIKRLLAAIDIYLLKEVGMRVNDIIDWEESTLAERVCVRPGIDEELDNRKHVYHGIDSVLSNVAHQISQSVPTSFARTLNVVYFPQLGYLICIPLLQEWEAGTVPVQEGWILQFSSDAHIYFKSPEMHDMDIHIGDLHSAIVDREIEIVQTLLGDVRAHDKMMGNACDICAELDCLLSFAEASKNYNYKQPDMVDNCIIDIIGGRHPLQEQVVDVFVPNDTRVVGGAGTNSPFLDEDGHKMNSVLLCTGANACGKTYSAELLSQVALIQIMAQVRGFSLDFVPAEYARLGVVDKIFTRVSTRESVSKVQSAFMIDLNQVSLSLRNCTKRSLILLDEFGKGTLSTDGAGLFCGVLKHLLNRGSECPKVLAATHFHDVFTEQLLDPRDIPITFCHMQVIFCASEGSILENSTSVASSERSGIKTDTGEKITYLYRVAEGLSLDSHAGKCAALCGLPSRIIQRARYVSDLISQHELNQLLDEEMGEKERSELKAAEDICRKFLAWQLDEQDGKSTMDKLAEILSRLLD
ncbi:hypothetical protein P691DRAFT_659812 [Macrolepiota fuliginosa MF-IS2]|uniref:DNA mismatch repair proteins mutS family domain-containing protein n=1 Tax=Macrolepiota fuliginosa MF-IS2 TaxID=1400762 RepID=A0A9P6C991_9AGAR|nr:hypothetical protein P691DRAFT_659812 [Macrolepiota fuliginosa MF-IS2]